MKFGKWVLNNFWLKAISLIFALITWFYVVNIIEDTTGTKTILAKFIPSYSRMISKKLFIKAVFTGELQAGYKLKMNDVKIDPPFFIVAGPRHVMNKVEKLETVPIDISKYKKTVINEVQIAPVAPSVDTEKLLVRVIVPIEKIEPETEAGAAN